MAGYTRNDVNNNIATGNIIRAADIDGEFDAVQAAFNASAGHTHDGSAGQGGAITKIGPGQNVNVSSQSISPAITDTMSVGTDALRFSEGYFEGVVYARAGFEGNVTGNITGNLTGNADTASTLETPRTITLAGDVAGSVAFDGGANVTITTNVADDSHNHTIANVDGLQTELNNLQSDINLRATINDPVFTGNPQAPTVSQGNNSTSIATTAYVDTAVSSLVDSAPGTLDTLNELAAALGDDPNFAATITSTIATLATQTAVTQAIAAAVPSGLISMWSGSLSSIPEGWVLCDGENNTPDLRDKFVVGAGGNYAVSATGGSADAIVPEHTHGFSASFTTDNAGSHSHSTGTNGPSGSIRGISEPFNNHGSCTGDFTKSTGFSVGGTPSGSTDFSNGGAATLNGAHTHSISTAPNHKHTGSVSGTTDSQGTSATNANLPPYYSLAYIMKV